MLRFALLLAAVTPQSAWTIDMPTVRIGEVEAAQAYMFAQVNAAARLSDGRVVVADGASNQLRVEPAVDQRQAQPSFSSFAPQSSPLALPAQGSILLTTPAVPATKPGISSRP